MKVINAVLWDLEFEKRLGKTGRCFELIHVSHVQGEGFFKGYSTATFKLKEGRAIEPRDLFFLGLFAGIKVQREDEEASTWETKHVDLEPTNPNLP